MGRTALHVLFQGEFSLCNDTWHPSQHDCCRCGLTKRLLEKGCSPNAVNRSCIAPLTCAWKSLDSTKDIRDEVICILVSHGAHVNEMCDGKETVWAMLPADLRNKCTPNLDGDGILSCENKCKSSSSSSSSSFSIRVNNGNNLNDSNGNKKQRCSERLGSRDTNQFTKSKN